MKLDDSAALVTGGASGLGEATARQLRQRFPDLHITLVDVNDVRGPGVAAELDAIFVHADVTSQDEIVAAIQTARTVHPLRAVVNCAGGGSSQRTIGRDGRYDSAHPLAMFDRVLRLNAVGTFNVIRLAASAMSTNEPDSDGARGAIVNTASIAGLEGQIGQAAYAAGKAAIMGMTLPIARDLSAVGVRVNTIAPGTFDTPPMRAVAPELFASLGASVPFPKRLGAPTEFASLAIELLTNSYINGATMRLDGAIRMAPK
jgi:NAD(P)-dependent dehydrogenase (short-subunit alcohol dehydrogenase family)